MYGMNFIIKSGNNPPPLPKKKIGFSVDSYSTQWSEKFSFSLVSNVSQMTTFLVTRQVGIVI